MADLSNPTVQKILQSTTIAHLATIGPDGRPQSSPMAFHWDGEYIKLTTTVNRQKYQNIKRDPHIALSITDVYNPYTYAEFRGVVQRIEEDPAAAFYLMLAERYGIPPRGYQGDPRVILYVTVRRIVGQNLEDR